MTTTWALVPARSFARGKSRLEHLGAARAAIARALCEHVVDVLVASPGIRGVLVATDGEDAAITACARGAHLLFDPPGSPSTSTPLAEIADRGLDQLARHGAERGLIVMGDLPCLDEDDVAAMLAALGSADVVLAPDRDQLGTNALALHLGLRRRGSATRFGTCFGHVDSYRRHLGAARGLAVATCQRPGLAFDLDQPADVDALCRAARPLEAEALVGGEGSIRAEGRGGVGHTVERIAALVAGVAGVASVASSGLEGAQHAVQRRPLGGDAPGAARSAP
jgi:2-phospho-L-lactate guanylyltransferase